MVVIGPDSYIMTSEGLKVAQDYISALQVPYSNLQTFNMGSNGVLCLGTYPVNYKTKCFIGDVVRYRVKTEMMGDEYTYIYGMVTDGFEWSYPKVGNEVYRVIIEETPRPIIDKFVSVEEELVGYDRLAEHAKLIKPPIGIVINSFPVKTPN